MGIIIDGIDMPKGEDELLSLDIYPNGKVYINMNIEKGQVATASETKQGTWSKITYGYRSCSMCGELSRAEKPDNYCPNCGAKMRSKEVK